ncbi:MAG: pitrilysin family protein [Planctomycetota bacterium]|nr:pitrilysin family protein [Planctomycetota bacterium]
MKNREKFSSGLKRVSLVIISFCLISSLITCLPAPPASPAGAVDRLARQTDAGGDNDIPEPPKTFQKVSHPDELKFTPLEIKIPKPERIVLQNGLVMYIMEDNELPMITIKVLIRNGALNDISESGKAGTANLVTTLLKTGGSVKYPSEALDEKLDFMAVELETSTNYEDIEITLSFLSRDFNICLDILKDILFAPLFPSDKLEKEKERILETISRENDEPDIIAEREFRRLIHRNHPFGNPVYGDANSVPLITVSDLKQFHQKYFTSSNMITGIVGSFNKDDIIALLKETFEKIPGRPDTPTRLFPVDKIYNKSINLVDKEITQSVIRLGHLGIERLVPDYFSVILMNAILGGMSTSRLYDQIREQRGLAYDVFSYFTLSRNTGMFIVATSTKNESVHQTISLIIEEIQKIRENLVEESELQNTKEGILNSFVFRFDNPVRVVQQYMYIEHIGLPADYLETYRDNIMKISREDIRRAAQKYLKPENYVLLVVGDSRKFDKPLSLFGEINEIKLQRESRNGSDGLERNER